MNIGTRFLPASEPYPGWNIADIEARGGKIYVSCHRKGCIKVLDRTTGEVSNTIPIPDPKGISIDKSGRLWVISRGNVARLNRDTGDTLLYYAIPVSGLTHAWDVELDEEGNIYVSVTGEEHQVHVYDKSGRLIRRIGKEKGGAIKDGSLERLYIPLGISVDSQDLMVADHGNGRIAVFDKKTGKYKRTIESFGYGGCNGAVKFVGNQDNVYTSNTYFFRHPVNNLNCYKTGISGNKPWEIVRRYANIAPAKSMEPMGIFNNGKKTYLCMMGRFPSWYEMDQEGVLHFCGALLYPRHVAPLRGTFRREVLSDLRRFGLVGEDDRLKYRIAWIDHNRDMRVQEDELEVTDDDAPFYSYNDGMVDEQGNMYMYDYHTHRFYRFRMNGYDKAGNPVYSWKAAEELIDLKDYLESKGIDLKDDLEGWLAYGKRLDSDGNMYFVLQKGASCAPDDVRIAGFAKDGRLLWEVGRKAKGLKDRPGEFVSSHGFLGIIDGIVFVLEYEGQADLYTTDGLYLATLLQGVKGKEGPYANYGGENFFGDVIKGDDGNIYFMINCHNYVVPIFRLENRETIKRFSSPVTVTKEWIEKAEEFKAAERGGRAADKTTEAKSSKPANTKSKTGQTRKPGQPTKATKRTCK